MKQESVFSKKIYFVRHGESEGNAGGLRGVHTHPLTQKGRDQAAFIAGRCAKLPVEALVSSTMTRAHETAQIISEKIDKTIELSDLFVEAKASSELAGKPRDSKEAIKITEMYFENFGRVGWKYSDEESFFDLKERASKALEYLANRSEEHILVVTHGFFMRIVVARAIFGEELSAKECQQFTRTFHMENTGLSILGHDSNKDALWPWWIWVWNDHAHLAD